MLLELCCWFSVAGVSAVCSSAEADANSQPPMAAIVRADRRNKERENKNRINNWAEGDRDRASQQRQTKQNEASIPLFSCFAFLLAPFPLSHRGIIFPLKL